MDNYFGTEGVFIYSTLFIWRIGLSPLHFKLIWPGTFSNWYGTVRLTHTPSSLLKPSIINNPKTYQLPPSKNSSPPSFPAVLHYKFNLSVTTKATDSPNRERIGSPLQEAQAFITYLTSIDTAPHSLSMNTLASSISHHHETPYSNLWLLLAIIYDLKWGF